MSPPELAGDIALDVLAGIQRRDPNRRSTMTPDSEPLTDDERAEYQALTVRCAVYRNSSAPSTRADYDRLRELTQRVEPGGWESMMAGLGRLARFGSIYSERPVL